MQLNYLSPVYLVEICNSYMIYNSKLHLHKRLKMESKMFLSTEINKTQIIYYFLKTFWGKKEFLKRSVLQEKWETVFGEV